MSDYGDLLNARLRESLQGKGRHGQISLFCIETKFPRGTVVNWLDGTAIPLAALPKISKWFGCEPWELLKPQNNEETQNKSIALVPKADEMRELLGILATLKEPEFRRVLKLARALDGFNGDDLDEVSHDVQEG